MYGKDVFVVRTTRFLGCTVFLAMILMTVSACGTQAHADGGPEGWQHAPRWAGMHGMTATVTAHNGWKTKWRPTRGAGNQTTRSAQPSKTQTGSTSNQTTQSAQPTQVSQPTTTPTSTSASSSLTQAAQAVFTQINQERAGAGKPALQWNSKLVQSAHQHNLAMAAANQLSHQLPGEADFGTRERNAGVNWTAAAENIGYSSGGNAQSEAVNLNASMFAEQPPNDGHRVNILSSNTNIGIDVYTDAKGTVWLTEDFATL
jgi:uncharacterized protein YkwD